MIEAQLVETFIINQVHLQSLIATKAARCVHAARGRPVVDFALRRTHGTDAGMKVARTSYLAGFAGTSNVMAGQRYAIPIVGTMAHSFVSSFEREIDAFRAYAEAYPNNSILLIDTYDTIEGARRAAVVGREMASRGEKLIGVRIDSGDLADQARVVRNVLNDAGLPEVKIIGSGGLDEYDLADMAEAGVPFDSYGVGTKMGTSADAPWTDMSYKLVEYDDRPMLKLSSGKVSCPGQKQIFRKCTSRGTLESDLIGLRNQRMDGEELLKEAMRGGKVLTPRPALSATRAVFAGEFAALPDTVKAIRNPSHYQIEFSSKLTALRDDAAEKIRM
jgi:nicotinate phosphoribosyltransferase